ncbi:Mu transposase C-terminal domain-containing protein [Streptomyces sp. NPDC001351]|uniref:Mu transposase C-terminal domain-containing protein n=1 Tax=Streptomyces sp. NPDC001351 TaxID=3364564 RepID=UPI00369F1E0F
MRFDDRAWVVSGFSHGGVEIVDPLGDLAWLTVPKLVSSKTFDVLERGPRSRSVHTLPTTGDALERARWWERHIVEVITGLPPGADDRATPCPKFDPAVHSLGEREAAKAAELAAEGVSGASARTVRRRRQRYQALGIEGLIDGRAVRKRAPGSRQDPRVLEVLTMIVADDTSYRRTTSVEDYRRATGTMLSSLYGPGVVKLPSRSTFQRLVKELTSKHGRVRGVPVADKAGIRSSRPGERVYVDTVALGIPQPLARLASQPVLMTVAVDELTMSVCTVMIHSSRRPLDGALLLARLCDPPALRDSDPGMLQEAVPLIMPESLLLDRRLLRRPRSFTDACRHLGITVRAPEPTGKARGERVVGKLVSLFNAELALLETDRISDEASLIVWLQTRAERWVESFWQHRPQQELRTVAGRGAQPTPSAAYDACVARLGWVHLPPDANAVRSFLPSVKRRVSLNGVYIRGHRYDCPDLDHLRAAVARTSGAPIPEVQVRFDPHDVHQVWVQTDDTRWIRVPLARAELSGRHSLRTGDESAVYRAGWSPFMPPSLPVLDHDQERLAYHAQLPLLLTPFLQDALRLGQRLVVMNQARVCGHHGLLITGPPGSGKTTALQELGRRFELADRSRHPDHFLRVPAVYLRIQPSDSTRTVFLKLAELLPIPRLPKKTSTTSISESVRNALLSSGTSVVLVDDAFTARPSSPRRTAPVDQLRSLADEVPATFVYAGVEEQGNSPSSAFRTSQGRLTHLRAAPVPFGTGWVQMVETLDQALQLRHHQPGSLVRLAQELHAITGGWPGALAHLVRSAAIDAILTGNEKITEQNLKLIAV